MADNREFVEQMGFASESDGLSRIAGRLFGTLLLSEEPRSLDELAADLDVSKASVSTEARRLLERGVADRVSRPGDRRDFYQLAPDFFGQILRHRIARWSRFRHLAVNMLASQGERSRVVRDRLEYIDDLHAFVVDRIENDLREWGTRRKETTPSRGARRAASRSAHRGTGRG